MTKARMIGMMKTLRQVEGTASLTKSLTKRPSRETEMSARPLVREQSFALCSFGAHSMM